MQTAQHVPQTSSALGASTSLITKRPPRRGRHHAIGYHAIVMGSTALVLLVAAWLSLTDEGRVALPISRIVLPEICTFRNLTGLACPGCGLTRSFICLMDGDVPLAWRFNPAGLVLFAAALFQFPYRGGQIWCLARGGREWDSGLWLYAAWALAAVVLVQWIWRVVL